MPLRKAKGKKYQGIYEYYRSSDSDKATVAYYITYRDETGKSTGQKKIDANTIRDALRTLNDRKAEADKLRRENTNEGDILQQRVRNNALTFDEMAKLYYTGRDTKNNSRDSQRYKNHLSPLIGRRKVSRFTTADAVKLQKELLKRKIIKKGEDDGRTLSPKTVDDTINNLKAMFNEGTRDKNRWCSHNPVADKDVKMLTRDEDKARLRILSEDERQKLFDLAQTNPRMYLLMKILYHTAARPDAIISLRVKDIKQKKLHLKAMKKAKAYSVPMVDEVALLLQDWIAEHALKYSDYIFYPIQTGDKTKPAIYEVFRRAAKSIMDEEFNGGIPITDRKNRVTLYTLRHTAATRLVKKLGIKVAKEYLNHSDIKVTEIYAKVDDDDMKTAAEVL